MSEIIATPKKTREIIEKYDFCFKKGFGQNFLIDANILYNIVKSADIKSDDCVIEIGPGIGSLTQIVSQSASKVIAIEIDSKLIPILKDTLGEYDNIEIINADVLKLDLNDVIKNKAEGRNVKIVANLPYYITTPIIMGILENKVNVDSITVMVQKEVAQRISAKAGSKDYGALSVAVSYYCETSFDMVVSPNCFIPKPNVESAVVTLKILKQPSVSVLNEKTFFDVVKCAFGQRRKTFANSLANMGDFGIDKSGFENILKECGLDTRIRGEAIDIELMAIIADKIYKSKNKL